MTNTVVVESHATTRTTTVSKESIKASTSTQNDNKKPNPVECLEKGLWEIEIIYYTISNGHRSLHNVLGIDPKHKRRGKIYKCLADNEYKVFESHDGIFYWPGDSVYLETAFNDPYIVATISNFKPAKREQISMKLTRYYRPEDIPEVTYQLLGQERKEHNLYEKMLKFESRELFQNEIACSYPISFLRGKCVVKSYRNITELDEIQLEQENIFFSCFNYNLDSNRLVPFHGTIRQGPRHQVDVPPMPTESVSEDRDRDQLLYRPGQICQSSEEQYIRGCRAYRTLCLSRKPQIPQLEKDARLGDLLFDDAINNLHNCRYNIEEAQHVMNEHDNQLTEDNSFLTAEDVKKFTKGIKNYGKNFTKIQKELLPYHMREHLVNFYYMWKKSRDATRPRAIQRARPPPKKGFKNGTPLRSTSADLIDYASASEDELGDIEERACHHCYSLKSKDWHHAGFFRQLLCTECRLYFKKYGSMREVQKPIAMPLCLHRGSPIDEGVRTRANGKHRRQMESPNDDKLLRKSRKRLHRHSAASDDLQENSNMKRINKKKTNGEPNDGEESESESSSSGKQKSKKVNGYQSSSSSASSPSAKEEQIEEEPKKENGIIKTEIKEEKLVEIKDEKENFYIKKEIEEDGASCFLTESELKKHIEECAKDVDEKVSIIVLQSSGGKRELRSTIGEKLPILEPAVFEQVIQRPSKSTCARTDFIYHNPKPISWMEKRRIREEKRERELFLERRRREEEEKMRIQSVRPSTSQPPTTTPIISVPMPNIMQQKTAMELLNGPSDQMANVIQRIQMGAIPQPMPMMGGMDPRIILQQHAQHQTALMMMIQMQEQQKIQAQIQQQQEAQRIAEQRKLEEQKRQQEQRQREVAAAQAAQMNGVKQSMPVQAQNMLQAQQLQQLMMNQQLFSNNPLMMAALIQQQQQQGQLAAAQAQAEYENRKRYEMEIQHRMVQQQRAAVEAQLQQQHQQHSVAAALSQFANMVGGGSNVPGPAPTSNAEQMFLSMMQQQQQHPMALLEAIRKYSEARTA